MKTICKLIQMLISTRSVLLPLMLTLLCSTSSATGVTIQKQTKEAYSRYIEKVEGELIQRREGILPFCRASDTPGKVTSLYGGLPVITNLNKKNTTPGGIIHDWIGVVFIPGVTLKNVTDILIDYDSHKEIFSEVVDSEMASKANNLMTVFLRFKKKEIITVVTDTHHEARLYSISEKKAQLFSRSIKINEVENYGEKNEKLLPEGEDHGFLWKMNAYWNLEENSKGVLVECRSITLSRDIPFGLHSIIRPIINRMPRASLESVLSTLKKCLSENSSGISR